jgi:hypothetical protein
MDVILPPQTKAERVTKRSLNIKGVIGWDRHQELGKDVSDIWLLAKQEENSSLPVKSSLWSKPDIKNFIKLTPKRTPKKDRRVKFLRKVLDIGAMNTIELIKVIFLVGLFSKNLEFDFCCATKFTDRFPIIPIPKNRY